MRSGAATVRAEMRRAASEQPREGEARHEYVRRLLFDPLWADASDFELAAVTGASLRTVQAVRARVERETRISPALRVYAADLADALGLASGDDVIRLALEDLAEKARLGRSEARKGRAATSAHVEAETGSVTALRARVGALLAVSRELRGLRSFERTENARGASRSLGEMAAYREAAAGVAPSSETGSRGHDVPRRLGA